MQPSTLCTYENSGLALFEAVKQADLLLASVNEESVPLIGQVPKGKWVPWWF